MVSHRRCRNLGVLERQALLARQPLVDGLDAQHHSGLILGRQPVAKELSIALGPLSHRGHELIVPLVSTPFLQALTVESIIPISSVG